MGTGRSRRRVTKKSKKLNKREFARGVSYFVLFLGIFCGLVLPDYRNLRTLEPTAASEPTETEEAPEIRIRQDESRDGFRIVDGNARYYEDGSPVKSRFVYDQGDLYYLNRDGFVTHGWYQNGKKIYYFDKDGKSVVGWVRANNGEYYYIRDQEFVHGWLALTEADGIHYYYFDEFGELLRDRETPDGRYVDSSGRLTEGTAGFVWDKSRGGSAALSGLYIDGTPAEFFMLSIAGETSGAYNIQSILNGDKGRAYGLCQFDYRYDLVGFMNYAYQRHPELWGGFSKYLSYPNGSQALRSNAEIGDTFLLAMRGNYELAVSDQLSYVKARYWDSFAEELAAGGIPVSTLPIAVQAAFLSVNVNCGPQSQVFLSVLSPEDTPEEMIRKIYDVRNTVLAKQRVGSTIKGTSGRYRQAEPEMALDLLYGLITIDSHVRYGSGVEWHGNPFVNSISTMPNPESIDYARYRAPEMAEDSVEDAEANAEVLEAGAAAASSQGAEEYFESDGISLDALRGMADADNDGYFAAGTSAEDGNAPTAGNAAEDRRETGEFEVSDFSFPEEYAITGEESTADSPEETDMEDPHGEITLDMLREGSVVP